MLDSEWIHALNEKNSRDSKYVSIILRRTGDTRDYPMNRIF
jgi:hypothetical protein